MKKILILLCAIVIATFGVGCSLFSSEPPPAQPQGQSQPQPPPPQNPPSQNPAAAQSRETIPVPTGACQALLWGKVTSDKGQSGPNIAVEITSGSFKAKTVTDSNGLYGFAGLCAGEYTFNVTPPNGRAQPAGNKTPLEGGKQVKIDLVYKQ